MSYKPASQAQDVKKKASEEIITVIRSLESQVKAALPDFLKKNTERIIRIVMTEVRKNPELVNCNRETFYGCVVQAAQLGLEPGSALGQCWILPYRNKGNLEAQLIIGYQGMVELAERTGMVTVEANVVYEKHRFRFSHGINDTLEHEPYFGLEDRGEVIGAYAIAKYADGRYKFRVLGRSDIEKARSSSKAGESKYSPWATHYAEMAQKTAVRRLFKMLPKSPEILRVQQMETQLELGESQRMDLVLKSKDAIDMEIGEPQVDGLTLEQQEALTDQK